ncbi:MAG: hypothetical protein KDK89_12815 [Alphaproteobacteria bacterium]|nr:hypothetical protein [Alphaproteobacteria bacterium]
MVMSNVVSLKAHKAFSHTLENEQISEKIQSNLSSEKMPGNPQKHGAKGATASTPHVQLTRKSKEKKKTKNTETSSEAQEKAPQAIRTPGPEGYKHDCHHMSATELHAAYKSEYRSWSNSKNRSSKPGWKWSPAWNTFHDFLMDMGPKPPGYQLDRIDNNRREYGPGLCRWASRTTQNNNKSDNVLIALPGCPDGFSPKDLAELRGCSEKTIRRRIAEGWTPVELIAGKQHPRLAKMDAALAAQLAQKAQKPSPGSINALETEWREACLAFAPDMEVVVTPKDRGRLKTFAEQCAHAMSPAKVIELCVSEWSDFTTYAKQDFGAYNLSSLPTIDFLAKYPQAAVNFAKKRLKEKADEADQEDKAYFVKVKKLHAKPQPEPKPVQSIAQEPVGKIATLADIEAIEAGIYEEETPNP